MKKFSKQKKILGIILIFILTSTVILCVMYLPRKAAGFGLDRLFNAEIESVTVCERPYPDFMRLKIEDMAATKKLMETLKTFTYRRRYAIPFWQSIPPYINIITENGAVVLRWTEDGRLAINRLNFLLTAAEKKECISLFEQIFLQSLTENGYDKDGNLVES